MNDITLEVYRFAGSQLNTDLEDIVNAGTLTDGDSRLANGIAKEVVRYLKGVKDDEDTERIRKNLERASSSYTERLAELEAHEMPSDEDIQRALITYNCGADPIMRIPIYVFAIHYHAGQKLLSVINKKTEEGAVDKSWHLFSEALAGRIREFLNNFISFYDTNLRITETRERLFFSIARSSGIPDDESRFFYDTMNKALEAHYRRFKTLITNLDAAVARMEQYVMAHPQPV